MLDEICSHRDIRKRVQSVQAFLRGSTASAGPEQQQQERLKKSPASHPALFPQYHYLHLQKQKQLLHLPYII